MNNILGQSMTSTVPSFTDITSEKDGSLRNLHTGVAYFIYGLFFWEIIYKVIYSAEKYQGKTAVCNKQQQNICNDIMK